MNNDLIQKIAKIVSILFMVIGAIFIILIMYNGDKELENDLGLRAKLLNPYFWISYVIFGLCAFFALIFPIIFMIQNPKKALRTLFVLIGFVIIFGIAYLLASDAIDSEPMQKAFKEGEITEIGSRRVGMGLIGTYIVAGLAIIVTIYAGLSKMFKH